MEIINIPELSDLVIKLSVNLLVLYIIIKQIYYRKTPNFEYLFTYFTISIVIFLLCYFLNNVKIQLGFALGLFALFGVIRYRTGLVPIREMTYLFLTIGVSVLNALSGSTISITELAFVNIVLIGTCAFAETFLQKKKTESQQITYEKIELIKPEKRPEMLADLKERTGLEIYKIEITQINFLRDTADVKVYYYTK